MASRNQRLDSDIKKGVVGTVESLDINQHRCILHLRHQKRDLGRGVLDTSALEETFQGVSNYDLFLHSSVPLNVTIKPLSRERVSELNWNKGNWEVIGVRPRGVKSEPGLMPLQFISENKRHKIPGAGYRRQGIPRVLHPPLLSEVIAETIHAFRKLLSQWDYFPVSELLNIVRAKRDFVELNLRMYFRSRDDLVSFFRAYPQYFVLANGDQVVYLQYQFSQQRLMDFLKQNQSQNRSRDLATYQLVESVDHCRYRVNELRRKALRNPPLILSMDCEGVNLGKDGHLTLLQLGTIEGEAIIFDVLATPNRKDMFQNGGLKGLLEDENILKVIHDCRTDQCALYFQFGVVLTNVFDTSAAYTTIWDQCNVRAGPFRPKLSALLEVFGFKAQHKTGEFEKRIHENQLFGRRPLTKEMIEYAIDDVLCLVPVIYETMNSLISPLWRPYFEKKIKRSLEESCIKDPHEMYEHN